MGLENFLARCNQHVIGERFSNVNSVNNGLVSVLMELVSMIIVVILVSLVGSYLWNNSVFKLFKGANKSQWVDVLALTVLLKIGVIFFSSTI